MPFSAKAHWALISIDEKRIVIDDVGPWDRFMSITNAAENTVEELDRIYGIGDRRVFYYDSDNELTELKIKNGKFIDFGPATEKDLKN
ncbi:MAG: hypothetical protein PHI12_14120 [Dehalococcoidales bacterium]|nr:hypothetical protein [Dehalococcoidales bacterium]